MTDDTDLSEDRRLEQLLTLLGRMAGGDLSLRIPTSSARDKIDAIAFGVNILADEVQFRYAAEAKRNDQLNAAKAELESALEELRDTQEQLIHSAKMTALGELTTGLAHEINNPMMIIRAYASRLEDLVRVENPLAVELDPYLRCLEKINQGIDRMVKTVKYVQDFTRRDQATLTRLSLRRIVESALDFVKGQIEMKGISLESQLADQELVIRGNSTAIEHVLLNLISNATDAIGARGETSDGRIIVRTFLNEQNACLEVQDNGVGIAPAIAVQVFQPFFTTKAPGRGTGLGLSISKRIVNAHNGEISFQSCSSAGTTFSVRLPSNET